MTHALTETVSPRRLWPLPETLRRVLLLLPPLALAALAGLHPRPDVELQSVMDVATWFAAFHVIQLVLVGLVALSVLLLADEFGAAGAWTTRLGIGIFLIFFSAYDAVAGIATGFAMRHARELSPAEQNGVWETVKDWPGFDLPVFTLGIVGTAGWVVALVGVALAARRAGAPRAEWIFIALAGLFLMGGHPFPAGTIAFGCLFIAALLHERPWLRDRTSNQPADPAESSAHR
jgi:hypothetical protein